MYNAKNKFEQILAFFQKKMEDYSVRKSVNTRFFTVIGNIGTNAVLHLCIFKLLLSNTLGEIF